MKKVKIIVNGVTGRVGEELVKLLHNNPQAEFLFGIASSTRIERLGHKYKQQGGQVVVIDFSTPQGLGKIADFCIKNKLPLVSGTTGLSPGDKALLKKISKKVPVLWSPNMSLGVNLFLKTINALSKHLSDYDLLLEDKHHKRKLDSPSGTAKLLMEEIERVGNGARASVQSTRGGGIVGIHKLWLMAEEELLCIEHTAMQRAVFARGALGAAHWLLKQKNGFYSFQDYLRD